jgi:hypothetical protein
MPDPELDALADAEEIGSAEQILAQAQHMLDDPRSAAMVTRFNRAYLGMGPGTAWEDSVKKPESFPEFNAELLPIISADSERFLDHVVLDGGTFSDLFQSQTAFLNAELAPLYGLDPADFATGELLEVELQGRPGFLTRVGFLSANANYDRSSPIRRGAWILKNVLGVELPPPPPEAATEPLPSGSDALSTNRRRVEAQTSKAECLQCHAQINPLGFVLEGFNAIGMSQSVEADTAEPIDTVADVTLDGATVTVKSPAALMALLVNSSSVRAHYARLWVNSAFERDADTEADDCALAQLSQHLSDDGYSLRDLIADLTLTPQFRRRTVELSQ